jgi:secreted protein with Ig-like and vWFA domain
VLRYSIPEQSDNFGELSALGSLQGGGMSGGLGGSGSGSGFGRPSGLGSGSGGGFGAAPRPRIVPPPPGSRIALPENERYGELVDPSWQRPQLAPLSTFSIDVDNASYSNIRRMIRDGQSIPPDAVRIEECINAFDYAYEKPKGDQAFGVQTTLATCPWNEAHMLLKIGIKGREISAHQRPASNLVFLIDVSGSMQDPRKLPLVKESLKGLLEQLDERDSVSYVVYAGSEGVVLPPTRMTDSGRKQAMDALMRLEAGGSTNGGSGIQRAYQIARENFVQGGVNRVILASDGDFNVGITDRKQLVALVKERAADHIYLSVLSFGTGNLNDELLESISKDGNGNYYYIDSIREGRRVFLQRLSGTLITIAKDVKIQVEFNPARVGSYRLIGYANRLLQSEDFNNDKVDAGDIGAGHTVTAFYQIIPAGSAGVVDPLKYQKPAQAAPVAASDEWLTLKLRHKTPEGDLSTLQESVVKGGAIRWQEAGPDFSFASAVSLFAMKLRGMDDATGFSWSSIRELAQPGLANDPSEDRAEFIGLLKSLERNR